ncbi:MAG: HEAT repeat domain-containing protein, partial [Pirellulaceae bacterium]
RQALLQTYGRVQSTLIHLLTTSARPGVLRLIFHFLDDPQPPPGIASVVAHRRDITFVRALCAKYSAPMSTAARANVRRIDNLAFLRDDVQLLQDLDEDEQCGLVSFVLATSLNRLRVFELLKAAMARGQTRVRRTACAGLVEFKGDDANHLVLAALEDPDPEVQSLAVQQVRERGIPNILPRLVELIDSPHEVVRAAVRATLTEFNFQRYLGVFEVLDPEVRRSTGSLVKRIDPWAIEHLIQELVSPVRARRLRGIAVAVAMRAVRDVEKHIVELAADDDHFVRADAARALLQAGSSVAHQTLENLLMDRSVSVQEAAAQSLARWTEPILEQSARPYLPHEHPILPLGTNEVVP